MGNNGAMRGLNHRQRRSGPCPRLPVGTRHKSRAWPAPTVVFLWFLLLPSFAVAAEFPNRFSAIYDVKKGPITIGETRRSLTPDGPNRFIFESITRPFEASVVAALLAGLLSLALPTRRRNANGK